MTNGHENQAVDEEGNIWIQRKVEKDVEVHSIGGANEGG